MDQIGCGRQIHEIELIWEFWKCFRIKKNAISQFIRLVIINFFNKIFKFISFDLFLNSFLSFSLLCYFLYYFSTDGCIRRQTDWWMVWTQYCGSSIKKISRIRSLVTYCCSHCSWQCPDHEWCNDNSSFETAGSFKVLKFYENWWYIL